MLPAAHPPPPPEGDWGENACAGTLWRLYGSPNIISQDGSAVLKTMYGLPAVDMETLYGWRDSFKGVLPATTSASDQVLKMEGCLDANLQVLRDEPWNWSGGTSAGHTQPLIQTENNYGNGKDSTVYFRFTPANLNEVTVTLKTLVLPNCSVSGDLIHFRAFCQGRSTGDEDAPDDYQALSSVGQIITFKFKPKVVGTPHILRFRASSTTIPCGHSLKFEPDYPPTSAPTRSL